MNEIEEKYRKKYPDYDNFTKRINLLLEGLLQSSGIKYHLIESRTKSIQSFIEKINRKQEKYKDPINEITDICALRIIVFYIDDLEKINKILTQNFNIDINNSFNAKNNLSDNQFGYLSSHYVVSLNNDRIKLLEWNEFKDIKAEIQVRTVLQHAWAAISHELEYKKTYDIPSVLKRKLFRLAGLIELADEEFQEAKKNHELVGKAIKDHTLINEIKVFEEINLNTIQNYFNNLSEEVKTIIQDGKNAGFTVNKNDKILKESRKKYLSDIIEICHILNIYNMSDFRDLVNSISKSSIKSFTTLFKIERKDWIVSPEFLVLLLMIFKLNNKQLEFYNTKNWSPDIWRRVKNTVLGKQ